MSTDQQELVERGAVQAVRVSQETERGARTYELEFTDGVQSWRERLWSVTTLLGALDKPAIPRWAAREVAAEAIAHRADLERDVQRHGAIEAVHMLAQAPYRKRDKAADVGTSVHALIEAYTKGETLPPLDEETKDRALAHLERFKEWEAAYRPTYLGHESTVVHPDHGWAGTLDLLVEIGDRGVGVVDIKNTSAGGRKKNEPGVYREHALQVAAYAHAKEIIPIRGVWADPVPMPPISWGAVLWLHADYPPAFIEVDVSDRAYLTFRYAGDVYRWVDGPGKKAIIGPVPPSVFGVLPSPDEQAAAAERDERLRIISAAQHRRLEVIGKAIGHDAIKAIAKEVAGVESTTKIPRDRYEDVVAAVEAACVAPSPAEASA